MKAQFFTIAECLDEDRKFSLVYDVLNNVYHVEIETWHHLRRRYIYTNGLVGLPKNWIHAAQPRN